MPAKKTQNKTESKYIDPELERFAIENKEMIEKILLEERTRAREAMENKTRDPKEFVAYHESVAKDAYTKEKELVGDLACHSKQRLEDAAQGIVSMFMDPDFQRHMASAGLEMLLAFDALMKAAPLPEFVKDAAEKAKETRDNATMAYCERNPSCSKKPRKTQQPEKVKIE